MHTCAAVPRKPITASHNQPIALGQLQSSSAGINESGVMIRVM